MSTRVDPDLDLGGRVALQDAFSRPAAAITSSFTSMRRTLSAGAVGVFQATAALTGGFRGLAASVFGPIGIAAALHHVGRATLQSASSAETTELAFGTLMRSSQLARAHLDELRTFALGKPFEFTQLTETSRRLQTYGFQVRDITGLLTDMGNAAFTSNTGYTGVRAMTRVFGNILATGRITFGQLNQLVTAGIPAHAILREQLNLTGEQLRNIARSGIPAERILAALRAGMQQRFAGGMDRASQTVAARLSDLADAAEFFQSLVGRSLSPRFKEILDGISGVAGNADNLRRAARQTAEVLDLIVLSTRAVFAVFTGGFRDAGDAWRRENGRFLADTRRRFQDLYLIVQGVSALLSGQDSRGIARIPRGLHDTLVTRGLWPVALRIAAWGARARAVIAGFVEGARREFRVFVAHLGWLGDALGLSGGRMGSTRADARRLGEQLARAARIAVEVRIALMALNAVLGAATVVTRAAAAATWAWNTATRGVGALRAALVWTSNTTVARWALTRATMALTTAQMRLNASTASSSGALVGRLGVVGAVLAASVASTAYLIKNHDRLRAMERRGTLGERARVVAISAITAPLGGGAVTAGMDIVRGVQAYGPRIARAVRAAATTAWASLRGAGSRAWQAVSQGAQAAVARVRYVVRQVLAPLQVIGSAVLLLGYTLTLGLALVGARIARWAAGLATTAGRAVGAAGARAGAAVAGFFERQWSALRAFGQRASLGLQEMLNPYAASASRMVDRIGAAFSSLGSRARASLLRLLVPALSFALQKVAALRVALSSFGTRVRSTLVGALTAARDAAVRLFRGIGDAILGGFRSTARAILGLYRALPAAVRPGALAGAESTLAAFAGGGDPAGTQASPRPSGQGISVQALLDRRATVSAGLAARGATAPTVIVRPPPPAPAPPVVVQIDGREVARAVQRTAEDDRIRRGGGGGS